MSTLSKDIKIGSGYIYVVPYTGVIPSDATIEQDKYLLGYVKDGANVNYTPSNREIYDNEGKEARMFITHEEVTIKFGVINWDGNVFKTVCSTSSSTVDPTTGTRTVSIGGLNNAVMKTYIVRFVHQDGKHRITMFGTNKDGWELGFIKNSATVISAKFRARPMEDGRLLIYTEGDASDTPERTLTISTIGTYDVTQYDYVEVNRDTQGTTATENDAIAGKYFWKDPTHFVEGTLVDSRDLSPAPTNIAYDSTDKTVDMTLTPGVYNGVSASASSFGNATAADVKTGKTFTSKDGYAIEGTLEVDMEHLSSSSTSPSGILTVSNVSGNVWKIDNMNVSSSMASIKKNENVHVVHTFENEAPASSKYVVASKKFIGSGGSVMTGTLTDKFGQTSYPPASQLTSGGSYLTIHPEQGAYDATSSLNYSLSAFGNATAADVMSGKTFTSSAGFKVTGTAAGGEIISIHSTRNSSAGTRYNVFRESRSYTLDSTAFNYDASVTNHYKLSCKKAGKYRFILWVKPDTDGSTSKNEIDLQVNGVSVGTTLPNKSENAVMKYADITVTLAVGDLVEGVDYCNATVGWEFIAIVMKG